MVIQFPDQKEKPTRKQRRKAGKLTTFRKVGAYLVLFDHASGTLQITDDQEGIDLDYDESLQLFEILAEIFDEIEREN